MVVRYNCYHRLNPLNESGWDNEPQTYKSEMIAAVVAVPDSLAGVTYGINAGQRDCGLGTRLILLLGQSLLMSHVFGPLVTCDTPIFPSHHCSNLDIHTVGSLKGKQLANLSRVCSH